MYSYKYIDSFKKFDECCLLSKECFFSRLKGRSISDEEYLRAVRVWNVFGIKNLGEYHNLYLKCDVLLLCDVFEKFVEVCLEYYGLDPCHYFSSSGLAWDAMLKMSGIRLRLIDDVGMHLFVERGMRGGISYVAKRYARANNEFVEGYDAGKEKSFITYWDVNNLYGCAMLEYLPYDGFEWVDEKEISSVDYLSVSVSSDVGYILEVDLEYPDSLHELHNDYPLAPENVRVSDDMLSDYCLDIAKKYGIKLGDVNKLIPNLMNKGDYLLHYRTLQLYVSLGMVVKKVHKVLKFKQSDWLKKFVLFNTEKRMNTANEFEKAFFKLIINSVYGKTIENVRKRVDVRLINKEKDYLKVVVFCCILLGS